MHRSGTSCLTGSLEEYGLFLGGANNQAPHNKKGNKENKKTWKINDLVLSHNNGSWDSPPKQLLWNDKARQMRNDFISLYQQHSIWGFKDPRTVLTLPFWLEASNLNKVKLVATFRHPLLVANSLKKRNGFTIEQSLSLWSTYNKQILEYYERFKFPIISYDLNSSDYSMRVKQIAFTLGLSAESSTTEPFYDRELKHQRLTNNHIAKLPIHEQSIYTRLCRKRVISPALN